MARKSKTTVLQVDAVSLLRADHKTLRQLLAELTRAEKPAQRQRLLAQVKKALEAHTTIEEEIFYPALREAARTKKDEQLVHEATAEHHAAALMLQEVGRADAATEEFPGRAKVLKEVVSHHAEEEETDMFPRVRVLIEASELRTLGQQMNERKRVLMRGGTSLGGAVQKVAEFVSASIVGVARTAAGVAKRAPESRP